MTSNAAIKRGQCRVDEINADFLTLYRGSYCEVREPRLQKCAPHKDFGRGFYLTTSESQAQAFAVTSLRKAISNEIVSGNIRYGVVSTFQINFTDISKLSIHCFPTTDREWLNCVVAHRRHNSMSDIVKKAIKYGCKQREHIGYCRLANHDGSGRNRSKEEYLYG